MNAFIFYALINDPASPLNKVRGDHKPIPLTHQLGKPAVNMYLENFKSYEYIKKPHLLANSANARQLHYAIAETDARQTL